MAATSVSDDCVIAESREGSIGEPSSLSLSLSPPPSTPLTTIVVDVRERALITQLGECGSVTVTSQQLELGDVQITMGGVRPALIIERKTMSDLAASVRDGRYREQKARLLSIVPADRFLMVIEGASKCSRFSFDARMAGIGGMPAAVLQGCVLSTLVRDNIRVVFTQDIDDTAAFIMHVARKLHSWQQQPHCYSDAAASQASVFAKKRDNVTARQCYIHQLCQVPGVSPRLASVVADAYPSMASLVQALHPLGVKHRVQLLSRLPGFGTRKSALLSSLLFGSDECAGDAATRS